MNNKRARRLHLAGASGVVGVLRRFHATPLQSAGRWLTARWHGMIQDAGDIYKGIRHRLFGQFDAPGEGALR
jgi:hypothetical protein